ncbi:hypothetical protein MMC21_004322 [Puttea exsequens]|nr:hypothetical protein [Puttea exsequens]
MPKKRAPKYDTRPSIPAHPSLSSSNKSKDAHSLASDGKPTGNTVNDLIHQLRISHGATSGGMGTANVLNPNNNPSLPPTLRSILNIPDAPPPRPRPGLRATGRIRGPAGPVPPSWQKYREVQQEYRIKSRDPQENHEFTHSSVLPDLYLPGEGSLTATTLKALAANWSFHIEYDQYYLATLPVRYKQVLLHYLSRYAPHSVDIYSLELLFLDDFELAGATGADGFTHLDLSTSIGYSLKLSELKDLSTPKQNPNMTEELSDTTPETWDAPDAHASTLLHTRPVFLLPNLTHLSLAHPSLATPWKSLIALTSCLNTITHLSLSHWPIPTLSPNSKTAYRETPTGTVSYGASNYYSAYDNDWSEAAAVLRRLSKGTYCLKWLDVTGCWPWVQALADDNIDWCGSWVGLETVVIGQGWIPDCLRADADKGRWKEVLKEARQAELTAQGKLLNEWVQTEAKTFMVEAKVNRRISQSMRDAPASLVKSVPEIDGDDGDDDWANAVPIVRERCGYRSMRVRFERGWEEYWVLDAIQHIAVTKLVVSGWADNNIDV